MPIKPQPPDTYNMYNINEPLREAFLAEEEAANKVYAGWRVRLNHEE